MSHHLSRRTLLKGLGAAIALPWLEAMGVAAAAKPQAARRMAFFYVPNGIHMPDWTPTAAGAEFELPATLKPLAPVKDYLTVFSGLTCDKARPHGDGPGDHARAMAAFLTGSQPRKTAGADIKTGISVDQIAAVNVGNKTRFASLEIGCEGGRQAGNCDSGYSCAYSSNLSWRSEATPMVKEIDPRQVFDRLFGSAGTGQTKADLYKRSILDFVTDEASSLKGKLGATDQRKLDEYLASIREIEQRIARAAQPEEKPRDLSSPIRPAGIPKDYGEHIRLLSDLLVLAFQADLTRISTFVYANEGSNRSYRHIDVPEGHHDLSHHGNDKDKQAKLAKINTFHIEHFAYLLTKLKSIREGERTLLDQCMILYGSGNGDGNRHNHDNLPVLLVGKGGSTLKTGRHVQYAKDTPITNLYLSMLDRMGVTVDKFGDSTGRLTGLE